MLGKYSMYMYSFTLRCIQTKVAFRLTLFYSRCVSLNAP